MPELDAETLMQDTNAGLARLVEETEKKAKLELERLNLERERAARQQQLLEKEEHHNTQLDRLVYIVDELNNLLHVVVKSSLDQLQDRIKSIYIIQDALLSFLINQYDKIKDAERIKYLNTIKDTIGDFSSSFKTDSNITVAGTVQSTRDINFSSRVSSDMVTGSNYVSSSGGCGSGVSSVSESSNVGSSNNNGC